MVDKQKWASLIFCALSHSRARSQKGESKKRKSRAHKKKAWIHPFSSITNITLESKFQSLKPLGSHILAVLAVLFWLSFPECPILAVRSQLSCPGCLVPALLSELSCPSCPFLAVLSMLSCSNFPVTAVLSWQSCAESPYLSCKFCLPCSGCHIVAVSFWLSCANWQFWRFFPGCWAQKTRSADLLARKIRSAG